MLILTNIDKITEERGFFPDYFLFQYEFERLEFSESYGFNKYLTKFSNLTIYNIFSIKETLICQEFV